MTLPALLLGVILSTLYGATFHLWRGGNVGRLILYILFSWIGFWTGQVIAERLNWIFFSVGPLHLGFATLVSWVFLFLGYWLSLIPRKK